MSALPSPDAPAFRERYRPIDELAAISWLQSEERHGNSSAAAAWVLAELVRFQTRLEQLEAVVRRAKFIRDSPAPYSVSRAAEQAAVAESARKILGPLAGEQ